MANSGNCKPFHIGRTLNIWWLGTVGDAAQVDVRMERRNLFLKGLSKKCELYPKAPVESSKDIKQVNDMIKFEI